MKKQMSQIEDKTTVPIEKYREVLSQSQMKDAKIQHLEESLHDAEFLLNRIKTEKDSIDKADREAAIDLVVSLSKSKITKESLKDTDTETINRMAELAVTITPPSAISLMRQAEINAQKEKPPGTVGFFNSESKKWEGGMP
jgi:hypothetical protein